MSAVLEPDLTWTGAGFEPRVQIAIDDAGRIDDVGSLGRPEASRLNRIALLPGFVNAHSHAFQRGLRGYGERFPAGTGSFWTWREAMYSLVGSLDRTTLRRLSTRAFTEMRDAGITAVGEFHYVHHERQGDFALDEAVLEAARDAGIRLVVLYCYYATSAPGRSLDGAQLRFATTSVDGFWQRIDRLSPMLDPATQSMGAAPHSIRAASPEDIRAIHQEAVRRGLPMHLHVEEQRREIEECRAAYGRTPMAVVLDAVEDGAFTAVHCTHTANEDMARFLAAGGVGCLCPLTEGNLGDGVPHLARLHAAGGRLALGTDSNARLSMLEDMRWLEYGQRLRGELRGALPDSEGAVAPTLLAAATTGGARALNLRAGRIAPGWWADFAAVDLAAPSLADVPADRLLDALVFGAGNEVIAGTYVGGKWRATMGTMTP
ncbi:MAG: formimidoylglutamate deiminase [Gemmatimonadales bacterium]|nr:formimidoylglutamate deiminase [Gemmatimonadales bacterium]